MGKNKKKRDQLEDAKKSQNVEERKRLPKGFFKQDATDPK